MWGLYFSFVGLKGDLVCEADMDSYYHVVLKMMFIAASVLDKNIDSKRVFAYMWCNTLLNNICALDMNVYYSSFGFWDKLIVNGCHKSHSRSVCENAQCLEKLKSFILVAFCISSFPRCDCRDSYKDCAIIIIITGSIISISFDLF